jgi:nitrilase
MRTVKAAAVQLRPVLYSREGTVDRVVQKIHELGQGGVQFATFPETVVPYYPYFSFVQSAYQIIAGREHLKLLDQAVTVPSPATNAISEACKEAGVVVSIGVNERDGGTLYNTRLHAHRQAQATHGLVRPLQPARIAESPDRPHLHRARSRTRCAPPVNR